MQSKSLAAVVPGVEVPGTSDASSSTSRNVGTGSSSASVASLLSQLQTSPAQHLHDHDGAALGFETLEHDVSTDAIDPAAPVKFKVTDSPEARARVPSVGLPRQDLRSLSFQQCLPHLAKLSEDPEFTDAIAKVRRACIIDAESC